MKLLSASILAVALLAGCGSYSPMSSSTSSTMADTPTRTADGVLVGPNGMTLYTFSRDAVGSGKSMCNGPCIANWPALTAPAMAKPMGDYSIVTRDDGAKQWAYKGAPLYYWAKDVKAGDRTGDGVGGNWKVARP